MWFFVKSPNWAFLQSFFWVSRTRIHLYSLGILCHFLCKQFFRCWLLQQGDADFKAEKKKKKKIPEHKDGQRWLCLVDTPSSEMYSVIFRQTEHPHTHQHVPQTDSFLDGGFKACKYFGGMPTHTHTHTHTPTHSHESPWVPRHYWMYTSKPTMPVMCVATDSN